MLIEEANIVIKYNTTSKTMSQLLKLKKKEKPRRNCIQVIMFFLILLIIFRIQKLVRNIYKQSFMDKNNLVDIRISGVTKGMRWLGSHWPRKEIAFLRDI